MNDRVRDQVVTLTNLQVENMETPLGLDTACPHFSWQMEVDTEARGYEQSAYQIIVKDEKGTIVWDTNKVKSGRSIGIRYDGAKLLATEKYTWTVMIWDQDGSAVKSSSWFETGLMNADPHLSVWDGACWIGGDNHDLPFYSHYLSVFTVKYSLRIDEGSAKAGFVLNANDNRLMDRNKNIYQMENRQDESYVKFELDIANVDGSANGLAKLNIYRVGFTETDSALTPFKSVDIPLSKMNQDNQYAEHRFMIHGTFGVYDIFLNPSEGEQPIFNGVVNPVGHNFEYLTHVGMLADIGFSVGEGQTAYFKDIEVCHRRKPSNPLFKEDFNAKVYEGIYSDAINHRESGVSIISGAIEITGGKNGVFLVEDPSQNAMPMLRTVFSNRQDHIKKARLYVTARGVYEIYMNGKRVGEDYFNPGYTQYHKTHLYQTYDVSDMIKAGENSLGAILGEGWWSGLLNYGSDWNYFGDRQSLLVKLVITYADGTKKVITSNPDEWKYFDDMSEWTKSYHAWTT